MNSKLEFDTITIMLVALGIALIFYVIENY